MIDQRTFTFPFEDEDWGSKFLMGSLFYLISPFLLFVPLIIPQGYALRVWRDAVAGLPSRLPRWDDWEEMGIRGLVYYVIAFLYSLPLLVVWAIVIAVAVGGVLVLVWVSEGVEGGDVSVAVPGVVTLFLVVIGGLMAVVALAISFFIGLLLSVAISRYLETGRFGAAFEFGAVWRAMRANLGGLVIAWVVLLVMGLLLGTLVGQLNAIPCCGSFFAYLLMTPIAFYLSLVQARLMGQVYHQAQLRLSSVPAVSIAGPPAEPAPVVPETVEETVEQQAVVPIETLELSTRVLRVLHGADITTVGQIMERLAEGDAGLLSIRGVGVKALGEIKAQLVAWGFLDL